MILTAVFTPKSALKFRKSVDFWPFWRKSVFPVHFCIVLARKTPQIDPGWIFNTFTQHYNYQFIRNLTDYEPCVLFYLPHKLEIHTSSITHIYYMAIFESPTWFLCHQTILELGSREIREGAK